MKVSKPGTSATRTFAGKASERVTAAVPNLVTSDGGNCAALTLLAPNGTTVGTPSENCNAVGLGPDTLKVTGTYTLRLTLYYNTSTGTGTLKVST
jgi:hypothetical protein